MMNKLIDMFLNYKKIQPERKILFAWIISIAVLLALSAILYFSKQELKESANLIRLNSGITAVTKDMRIALHDLEISSRRFSLTRSHADSADCFLSLDSLKMKMARMEKLMENHPRLLNFYIPFKNKIDSTLLRLDDSLKVGLTKAAPGYCYPEQGFYESLDYSWHKLDDEQENVTLEQIQYLQSEIARNLSYFFILIFIFISLLSVLFIVTIIDLRKRRKLAAEVVKRSGELNTIINTAPALIFVKNTERKFTLLNKSFLDFFGISKKEVLMRTNTHLVSQDEHWLADIEDDAVLNDKVTLKDIARKTIGKDGQTHWLNINKAPLLDEQGNVSGIVGVMDDITRRINFQEDLVKTRKQLEELLKQKDRFFSIIAHDLRSPFTSLLGFADLLRTDFSKISDEEKINYIGTIQTTLRNQLNLLDNLLTWARINLNKIQFERKEIYLKEVIESVFKSQSISADKKNISLINACTPDQTITADPDMMETVIRNLVSNSIKFTGDNGEIIVRANEENDFVKIEIQDNGVGMTPEKAMNLFKIDAHISTRGTADEKGTGLGLVICKDFVEKHGGHFSVISSPGKGTSVSFTVAKLL